MFLGILCFLMWVLSEVESQASFDNNNRVEGWQQGLGKLKVQIIASRYYDPSWGPLGACYRSARATLFLLNLIVFLLLFLFQPLCSLYIYIIVNKQRLSEQISKCWILREFIFLILSTEVPHTVLLCEQVLYSQMLKLPSTNNIFSVFKLI